MHGKYTTIIQYSNLCRIQFVSNGVWILQVHGSYINPPLGGLCVLLHHLYLGWAWRCGRKNEWLDGSSLHTALQCDLPGEISAVFGILRGSSGGVKKKMAHHCWPFPSRVWQGCTNQSVGSISNNHQDLMCNLKWLHSKPAGICKLQMHRNDFFKMVYYVHVGYP